MRASLKFMLINFLLEAMDNFVRSKIFHPSLRNQEIRLDSINGKWNNNTINNKKTTLGLCKFSCSCFTVVDMNILDSY